jgi:hypothetical protein
MKLKICYALVGSFLWIAVNGQQKGLTKCDTISMQKNNIKIMDTQMKVDSIKKEWNKIKEQIQSNTKPIK